MTILGHIQRGGTPTARDRVMATRMGYHSVKVLAEGGTNRLICSQQGSMVDIDLEEGLAMKKDLNAQQYEVLQAMTGWKSRAYKRSFAAGFSGVLRHFSERSPA